MYEKVHIYYLLYWKYYTGDRTVFETVCLFSIQESERSLRFKCRSKTFSPLKCVFQYMRASERDQTAVLYNTTTVWYRNAEAWRVWYRTYELKLVSSSNNREIKLEERVYLVFTKSNYRMNLDTHKRYGPWHEVMDSPVSYLMS